jgi:hypothetical protein
MCVCVCGGQTVKRVALQALTSLAHNNPAMLRDLLGGLLGPLYDATVVRVRPTWTLAHSDVADPR